MTYEFNKINIRILMRLQVILSTYRINTLHYTRFYYLYCGMKEQSCSFLE
jgi:hypothetical protein